MTEVKLENLSKHFGETKAVKDVNLTIEDGTFTVLLGPSGCGKTTTLRLIAGLEEATTGKVLFDGEDVTDMTPYERNIAMVFQTYALYPHMSAYDNIAFPLDIAGMDDEEKDNKVHETAEFLHIDHLLQKKPGQLSGGERQRTALGRAIVREPTLFLMDEPLSNLDAKLRMQMRVELKRLHDELGITTIYVTHDQIEAMTMGQSIVAMRDGEYQQQGAPEDLFMRPETTWVAQFIGTPPMNTLECSLEEENGGWILEGSGFTLPVDKKIADKIREKDSASKTTLGVRPGNFELTEGAEDEDDTIIGKVYTIEPTGESVIVDVEVGNELVKADVPKPSFRPETDIQVTLRIKDHDSVCYYDKKDQLIRM